MKGDNFGDNFSASSSWRRSGLSRRELLGTVAAAGAGAMLPLHSLWGQGSRTANGEPTDTRPIAPLTAKGGAIGSLHGSGDARCISRGTRENGARER